MKFTRCGLDIAKQVFQVHGVHEHGVVKGRKTLPRAKVLEFFAQLAPCLIGIEGVAISFTVWPSLVSSRAAAVALRR